MAMDEEENKRLGELIMELAKGNKAALEGIAAIMEKILFAIGTRSYRNFADAEDAVHEIYKKLNTRAKNFRENTNACAWIVTMFRNYIASDLRRKNFERKYLKEKGTMDRVRSSAWDEEYLEKYLILEEVAAILTKEEWNIFVYYHWCKCSVRDVAKALHKSKSTIEYKLQKLEEKLQRPR